MAAAGLEAKARIVQSLWAGPHAAVSPDGRIEITRGLLHDLTDAELTYVLAHELAPRLLGHHGISSVVIVRGCPSLDAPHHGGHYQGTGFPPTTSPVNS